MVNTPSQPAASEPTERSLILQFFLQQLPYVILILLAIVGMAYTDVSPQRSIWYWQALAPVYCLVCIASQWRQVGIGKRIRLVATQLLHWGVFLVTMRLVFLPVVQRNLDNTVTGLILLHLLALSTFLAGIYVDWRLAVVGVALALGLVAIAFFQQSAVYIVLLIVGLVVTAVVWARLARNRSP